MAEDPILDPTVLLRWPEFRKELRDIFRQASYADLEYSLRIAALAGYCETWDLEKVLEDSRSHEASIEYAIYYLRASFSPSGLAAVHRHFSRSVTVDILIAIGVLPAGIDRFSALNAALGRLQPDLLEGALLRHATPTEEKVLWPGGTGAKPLLTPDLPKRVRTIRSRLPEIVRLGYSIPAEYDLFLNILLGEQVDTGSLTLEMLELMIVVAHPQCPEQFSASEVRGTTWRNCGLYYDLPRFFRALRDWEPALSDYFIELAARGQIEQIEDCPVWVSLPVR